MGVYLVSYATRRRAGMEAREAEDVVNDYGRDPIGEGQEERVSYIFTFPFTDPQRVLSSTNRNTTESSKTFWTTRGTTLHQSQKSANVTPVRWVLSGPAETKTGNKRDPNWKNSQGLRWSNGSGEVNSGVLLMKCMYITLKRSNLLAETTLRRRCIHLCNKSKYSFF